MSITLCLIITLLPVQSLAADTIDIEFKNDITTINSITYKIFDVSGGREKEIQLQLDCDYRCPADKFGGSYEKLSPTVYTYTENMSNGHWGYTFINGSAHIDMPALAMVDSSKENAKVNILNGFLAYEVDTGSTGGANAFYCQLYTYDIDLTIPCGTINSAGNVTPATPYPVTGGNIYFDIASKTILECDNHVTQANVPSTINGESVKYIDGGAFDHSDITDVNLPNGVLSIGPSAFLGCDSLKSITLPASIHEIGNFAFQECENLSDVYYSGSEEQWKDISIGINNNYLEDAEIHYNVKEDRVDFTTDRWNFNNPSDKIPFEFYKTLYGPIKGTFLYMIDDGTEGHCYGMAATTAAINDDMPGVATFNKPYLINVGLDDFNNYINMTAREFVNCGHILQYSASMSKQKQNTKNNLKELYNAVKNFQNGCGAPVVISMRGDTKSKENVGHAVYALKIQEEDSESCKILINDSNLCNRRYILQLQKNANGDFVGWTYETLTTQWGSNQPNGEIAYTTPAELLYDVAVLYSKETKNESILSESNSLLIADIDEFTIKSNDNIEYIEQNFNGSEWIYPIKSDNFSSENESHYLYWIDTQDKIIIPDLSKDAEISIVGKSTGVTLSAPIHSTLNLDVSNEKNESAIIDLSSYTTTTPEPIRIRYTTVSNSTLNAMEIYGQATGRTGTERSDNGITVWGLSEFSVEAEINGNSITKNFSGLDKEKKQKIIVQYTENGAEITLDTVTEEISVSGIKLDKNNVKFKSIGEKYQLSANILPVDATNKVIIWTSSEPSVASVTNGGLVTAVSSGVATITAKTQDGGYIATCEVMVALPEDPNIPVAGVELNTSRVELDQAGDVYQLKADVLPANATNKAVTWVSSNPNVATVSDNGLVTAVSEGSATITVTTEDGQKVATCIVTVHIESSSSGTDGGGSGGSATPTSYTITTGETDGGTITISHKTASKGKTVTITAVPDEGFTLETLSVSDKNGNEIKLTKETETSYTFKMPESKVTVTAIFTETVVEPEPVVLPFDDISQSAWYYGAVEYVYLNHMMQGTAERLFSPDAEMSRAMIATVLYRLENTPAPTKDASFNDVETNKWYTDAIRWAAENNVINGYGNNRFGPMDSVTREQLAVILYNYTASKGISVEAVGDLSTFSDAEATSDWAEEAISWAVGVGLLSGKGNGILDPSGTATRAEFAQMLMNYLTKAA